MTFRDWFSINTRTLDHWDLDHEFNQEFNQIIIELYKNSFKIITFTGDANIIFKEEGREKERERESSKCEYL